MGLCWYVPLLVWLQRGSSAGFENVDVFAMLALLVVELVGAFVSAHLLFEQGVPLRAAYVQVRVLTMVEDRSAFRLVSRSALQRCSRFALGSLVTRAPFAAALSFTATPIRYRLVGEHRILPRTSRHLHLFL